MSACLTVVFYVVPSFFGLNQQQTRPMAASITDNVMCLPLMDRIGELPG